MSDEIIVGAFKALSDPTRMRIVRYLLKHSTGEKRTGPTASEICFHLTGAEKINSTISHHLHELDNAGLISIERKGKHMICTLRPEAFMYLSNACRNIALGEKSF
ncbi:MAG: helix-turn-helix transcriptional regulator [Fimbriimonadaceae bacterium]|nr:MAG: helix-turn-helix transcriptional regulator [Fimbriimonadaceae bacterium]